ncbi:hypothetical protein ACWGCW_11010 [Streptomyces sp. NPDC054933]
MTSIERTTYLRFKRLITAHELHLFFAPTREEVEWAAERMDSDGHQLALPLALKSYQRMRVQRFLIAAGSELGRIGAAQLATGRGDAMLRQYVEQRVDAVVYRRLDELFRDGHRRGLLAAPPELLSEITRGALERLLTSQLPRELDWTTADLPRGSVDTVLYGAIRSAHPGIDGEQLRAVMPTARDDEQEVGP